MCILYKTQELYISWRICKVFLDKDILQHLHFEFEFAKKTLLNNCWFTMHAGFPTKKGRDDAERTFFQYTIHAGFSGQYGQDKSFL